MNNWEKRFNDGSSQVRISSHSIAAVELKVEALFYQNSAFVMHRASEWIGSFVRRAHLCIMRHYRGLKLSSSLSLFSSIDISLFFYNHTSHLAIDSECYNYVSEQFEKLTFSLNLDRQKKEKKLFTNNNMKIFSKDLYSGVIFLEILILAFKHRKWYNITHFAHN